MTSDEKAARDLLREELQRFSELGERHLFRYRDGRAFEGWVVEVGEEDVLVIAAGPDAREEEFPIPFDDLDLGSLVYVDEDGTHVPFAGRGN
jgi:hypothetical protein